MWRIGLSLCPATTRNPVPASPSTCSCVDYSFICLGIISGIGLVVSWLSDDVIGKATSVVGLVASAGGEIAWKMNERTRRAADRALAEGRAVEQVETKTGEELGIAAKAVGKNYGAIEDLKTTGEELKQDAGKEEALRLQLMAAQEKVEELEKKITDLEGCLAAAQADDQQLQNAFSQEKKETELLSQDLKEAKQEDDHLLTDIHDLEAGLEQSIKSASVERKLEEQTTAAFQQAANTFDQKMNPLNEDAHRANRLKAYHKTMEKKHEHPSNQS